MSGPVTLPDLLDLLPAEILLEIIGRDEQTWYQLYRFYPRARALHLQHNWARVYVGLFKMIIQNRPLISFQSRIFDQLHSFNDEPALIYAESGFREWYRNGKVHRDDGPAVLWADGQQEWWRDGKLHRDDGPAVIYVNGQQEWYKDGLRYTPT